MRAESSVDRLDVSANIVNAFHRKEITTVGEVVALRPWDFLRLPNFGRGSLARLERELERHGLRLAP